MNSAESVVVMKDTGTFQVEMIIVGPKSVNEEKGTKLSGKPDGFK